VSENRLELDLDSEDPDRRPPPAQIRLRAVRVPLWVVALVAVGVVVPTVGVTRARDDERFRRVQQQQAVTLRASVVEASGTVTGPLEDLLLVGTLRIVNGGPLPVKLGKLETIASGATLSGDAHGQVISAASAADVTIQMHVNCVWWDHALPVDLRLDATTTDGVRRSTVSPILGDDSAGWARMMTDICLPTP
jgi:hypothetical protein